MITPGFGARAWRLRLSLLVLPLMAATGCEAIIGLHDPAGPGAAGGGNAGSAGKKASGGTGGSTQLTACENYCTRANDACKGDYAIYHGAADCGPACQLLSAEQLQCREGQVTAAMTSGEPYAHCQGAALGGSTACGGNCETYCALMDVVCTGTNRNEAEKTDCVKKCGALRDREKSLGGQPDNTSRLNVDRDHEGDSLQCRLVHLAIASGPAGADAHCWHAAIAPKTPAGSPINPCATELNDTEPHCEDYCQIVMNACGGDDKVYETTAQCLATCDKLVKGTASDDGPIDSVGCRKTHSYNALLVGTTPHCPHSGPGGAGICGTDCPAYCRLFKAGCDAAFKDSFGSAANATSNCESTCLGLRGMDPIRNYSVATASAKNANPIACRMLYATRALEHPDQQAVLCKSAAGAPDSSCKP